MTGESPAKGKQAAGTDGGAGVGKVLPRERGKKMDADDVVEEDAAGGAQEPKVDYKKLYDVPECPVFHPTAKEFTNPGKYIESISEQVCKVVVVAATPVAATCHMPLIFFYSRRRCAPLASVKSCRRRRGSHPL